MAKGIRSAIKKAAKKVVKHTQAFLDKQRKNTIDKYFKKMEKNWGADVARMARRDYEIDVAQARKESNAQQLSEWQKANPETPISEYKFDASKVDMPNYSDYYGKYYAEIDVIMRSQAVSKDVAETLWDTTWDETKGVMDSSRKVDEDAIKVIQNELKGRRVAYYNKATGRDEQGNVDILRSNEAKTYERNTKLAEKLMQEDEKMSKMAKALILADYRQLAEAAAEGRYREAVEWNSGYLEKMMLKADQILDQLDNAQDRRNQMLHDPDLDPIDRSDIQKQYDDAKTLIEDIKERKRDMATLLQYNKRGILRQDRRDKERGKRKG